MTNITAIVISFLRPGYTKACVDSLRKEYGDIKIIVGDNGGENPAIRKYCEARGAQYFPLEYDSGVCVARNELIKKVDTDYVLVGDDDFYYTPEAKVQEMKAFLEAHPEFDLIGGRVSVHGIVGNYQGFIEKRTKCFHTTGIEPETHTYETDPASGLRYCPADLTFNYFVARTAKVKEVPWDEEIKVAYEHFTWFYDFKCAGGKVAFSPDPIVVHKPKHVDPEQAQEYLAFRNRRSDAERFFSKYGIDYIIGINGVKTYAPNHRVERRKNDTKYVDFCITTFKRPKAVEKLLFSIADHYPMANVYVADQNETLDRDFYKTLRNKLFDAGMHKRVSIEHLPYDCGLSYARNHLVLTTPNKYKLILDDDFEFTAETDIGQMVELLETFSNVGIVGGRVRQLGVDVHFEFMPVKRDGTIYHTPSKYPMRKHKSISYQRTGCVLNFALMRKDIFQYIRWDQNLKVTEHLDFYLRMAEVPYQVLYTPDVVVDHPPAVREPDYKAMRQREEFLVKMMRKHGAKRIKYLNGQVLELMEDGAIKKYKELPE